MNKINSKIMRSIVMALLFFGFYGCFYDEEIIEELPADLVISFQNDVQPIFNANCVVCHPVLVPLPDLTNGNAYNSIIGNNYILPTQPENSLLFQRLIGIPSVMPPIGSLPSTDIALIRRWIEQGAQNN